MTTALVAQAPGIALPRPTRVSGPFWEGCARGELMFQRCDQCRAPLFDPMVRCRWCCSDRLSWERSAGRGEVYSWSVVWRPPTPAFVTPYAVVIVALDEGYHMLSNLIGCEVADVEVGLRVGVTFHEAGDGMVLPYFTPLEARP